MRRIVCFLALWCGLIGMGTAQTVVYVSEEGNDISWTGVAELPFKTVHRALEKVKNVSTPVEIRVAVGVYPISGEEKGELMIPANVTVKGGFLKKGVSGVQDVQAVNRDKAEGQSIFQGDSTCRIATVKGVLEQVVVTGGRAEGANGGGVLVESGGVVRNCIIRNNKASGRAPKVGDIILESGNFIDVSQYQYGQEDDVKGIVFWVNPKRDAPAGQRGRAVSLKGLTGNWAKYSGKWNDYLLQLPVEGKYCANIEEALEDTDGKVHTDFLLANTNSQIGFPLAEACRAVGPEWYLPAIGEIMWMLAEWNTVDNTFYELWNKIQTACGGNAAMMTGYFGCRPAVVNSVWYETNLLWISNAVFVSSTREADNDVWILSSMRNEARLEGQAIGTKMLSNVRFTLFNCYAVRCF